MFEEPLSPQGTEKRKIFRNLESYMGHQLVAKMETSEVAPYSHVELQTNFDI